MTEVQETVKLKITDWRHESFDPLVEGVAPITREGTDVPAGKEAAVREAARRTGISVRKEK